MCQSILKILYKAYEIDLKTGICCEILSWLYRNSTTREKYLIVVLFTIKYDYMVNAVNNAKKTRNI